MTDLDTLSGPALERLIEKRRDAADELCTAVIAAGHGETRMTELRALAHDGDALARLYVEACDAVHAARDQLGHRMRYHGSSAPINGAHTLHDRAGRLWRAHKPPYGKSWHAQQVRC